MRSIHTTALTAQAPALIASYIAKGKIIPASPAKAARRRNVATPKPFGDRYIVLYCEMPVRFIEPTRRIYEVATITEATPFQTRRAAIAEAVTYGLTPAKCEVKFILTNAPLPAQ